MNSDQWKSLATEKAWQEDSIVALIEWLPHLTKSTMPSLLRKQLLQDASEPISLTSPQLLALDPNQLERLVQWSDLIVFDYLTGNYDRVASMQVNIVKLDSKT